jgi:hypothetical protein
MNRRLTMIAAVFAIVAFAGAAPANHHEGNDGHGSHTEQNGGQQCDHASDAPCPHHPKGETCEHHTAGEPCTCGESGDRDAGQPEKSESDA